MNTIGPKFKAQRATRAKASVALTDMLDYQLYLAYRDCGHVTERICKKEFRINRRRWRILATLAQGDGISVSDLASRADLDLAQTSRTIGTLAREGLLKRLSCAKNARLAEIVYTEKGRALCTAVFKRYCEINRQLLRGLTRTQVTQFIRMLTIIRQTATALSMNDTGRKKLLMSRPKVSRVCVAGTQFPPC